MTRSAALARDAADPLGAFHERFTVAGDGVIYLDGNSLGRLPAETAARLEEVVGTQWGQRLIRGWSEGWMELPLQVGDAIGALIGAAAGQVAVADSTTVCFYKLAAAALAGRPGRREIITDVDNFPTDRYVVESLAAAHGCTVRWITPEPAGGPTVEQVAELIGPDTALVTFSHVAYKSAFVLDLAGISRLAREAGALCLWDLSHSVGSGVPVALDADGADLAVGCTYKYLNGGPGAPAFLYVRAEHQASLRQPIWGWLGRRDPFEMAPGYEPDPGIRAFLSGTPPVLALTAVQAGVALVAEAGVAAIREKSTALTAYAIELIDGRLGALGASVASPREAARRGSHVALVHPRARELSAALIERGVIVDFRTPDVIRLGLSPLTTRFTDVWDGIEAVRELLAG